MKLYCKNCKHYVPMQSHWCGDYCHKKIGEKDTPYARVSARVIKYNEQNKNNNCKYYQRSWYKFWVKEETDAV